MACFSTTKMAVASSCSVDEAIQEVLRLFPNLPEVKEKQIKEMYRFIVKKYGCAIMGLTGLRYSHVLFRGFLQ